MQNTSLARHAVIMSSVSVGIYLIVILWKYTAIDLQAANFHLALMKTLYPGFYGYNWPSILWGMVLSFVYTLFFTSLFHLIHEKTCDKCCAKNACGCDIEPQM